MNWTDLLRMSSSNLKRRKLRTFLTVLGVIIGTTSIVVMISLGLGMQKNMYQQIEQSGGLNTITVTPEEQGPGESVPGGGGQETKVEKRITDQFISQLTQMDHVKTAQPVYNTSAVLLKGKYQSYIQLTGMTPEGLAEKKINLAPGGKLPRTGTGTLELVYGNGIPASFSDTRGGMRDFQEEVPEIDLAHTTVFLILDESGYQEGQGNGPAGMDDSGQTGTADGGGQTQMRKPVPKYAVRASGVVAGSTETYNEHYYNVYCDLETLKQTLKKEFSGRAIPGQPTTKSGKPYKDFCYSEAMVRVDDIHEVDQVANLIRQMGYNTQTNAEYMESMKSQMRIIQSVLGGIGAVSLLVAAIGIANTMMMSIYERTKEIGVIKVLGCSLKNIRQMFLLEAAFIGLIGGAVGTVLSYAVSVLINVLTGTSNMMGMGGQISYIPVWLVLAAVAFAVLVGMAAGYFPAKRAMKLSPLAAIQNQ